MYGSKHELRVQLKSEQNPIQTDFNGDGHRWRGVENENTLNEENRE